MTTVTQTSPYKLRPRSSLDEVVFSPVGRKQLTPSKTATLLRTPGHNCQEIVERNTAHKVMARLAFSLHRFTMSFAWECMTFRGRTRYNGGTTHCGQGKCEAGHAALSPTVYDNKLALVRSEFGMKSFQELKLSSQTYMQGRFTLAPTDIQQLSDPDIAIRLKCFDHLVSRLSRRARKGSIADSPLELLRNATYSNPRDSNRVDCYLERYLRKIEDVLSNQCTSGQLAPEAALTTLIEEYKNLLEIAHTNLKEEHESMITFQESWRGLIQSHADLLNQQEDKGAHDALREYLDRAEIYLTLYRVRVNRKQMGVSKQRALMETLKQKQSPRVLADAIKNPPAGREAIEEWLKMHAKHLIFYRADAEFTEARVSIDRRCLEVRIQLEQMPLNHDQIHDFVKYNLSEKPNEEGTLVTPTKEVIVKVANATFRSHLQPV
jgi:hypothetical protein